MIHIVMALIVLCVTPVFTWALWNCGGFSKWGLLIAWLGEIGNIVALATNGWKMPVIGYYIYPETLWKSGSTYSFLPWLCDRFPIPHVGICSIGDLLIFTGVAVVLIWLVSYSWRTQ